MSVVEFKEVLWMLMLIPFSIVLGAVALFVISAVRWGRNAQFRDQLSRLEIEPAMALPPRPPEFLYERPNLWLAIKASDPSKILSALRLHDPVFCSWEEGLVEAREHKLFISPPIAGWILVLGADLPEPGEDVDKCFHFLTDLSRKVGHVQFFSANRALNHHSWVIVDRGQVFRAYAWASQTVWLQGPVTAAEKELGMACFDYTARVDFTQREVIAANTEKVQSLAGRWSIDPAAISETAWAKGQGIVGSFSPPKPH